MQNGWDWVKAFRTIRLTEQEAEALYVRLTTLQAWLPARRDEALKGAQWQQT
jgi:hypothetical protein